MQQLRSFGSLAPYATQAKERAVYDAARELLGKCAEAMRQGADFPTVWNTVIKGDPSVMGPPVQHLDGDRLQLRVRLISGERLVFDSGAKEFAIL